MAVDRPSRDRLAACIEAYLDGRMAQAAIWEEISANVAASSDAVVQECADYFRTTDLDDEFGVSDDSCRSTWNELQRRRLLLQSDARMDVAVDWTPWSSRIAAAAALVGFGAACCCWGWWVCAACAPLGMILYWEMLQSPQVEEPALGEMHPFDSYAQLAAVRKSVPAFRKRHGPFKPRTRIPKRVLPFWIAALNCVLMAPVFAFAGSVLLLVRLLETSLTSCRKTYRVTREGADSVHFA